MKLKFEATGFILKIENYDMCKDFYCNKLGLQVLEEQVSADFKLLKLSFGGSYLMIETGGSAFVPKKGVYQNPTVIRINVADISKAISDLSRHSIEYEYFEFDWGKLVILFDPDGNQVEIKA